MTTLSFRNIYTFIGAVLISFMSNAQDFQGKAYYFKKSTMELGTFGARLSEAQKKQIEANLKNRLEKTYILTFNKEASVFKEEVKLDAISGATDSWGKNFSPGNNYKNIKTNEFTQSQEFYGKQFLVKDQLKPIAWIIGKESKQIGNYLSFKATATIPTEDLTWYDFSWDELRNADGNETSSEETTSTTEVEAWYTPQIPTSHGPFEYWGLPGLILEVKVGNTIIACSEIILNTKEKIKIEPSGKGKIVSKFEYKDIITMKMTEMRDNRGRRRAGF